MLVLQRKLTSTAQNHKAASATLTHAHIRTTGHVPVLLKRTAAILPLPGGSLLAASPALLAFLRTCRLACRRRCLAGCISLLLLQGLKVRVTALRALHPTCDTRVSGACFDDGAAGNAVQRKQQCAQTLPKPAPTCSRAAAAASAAATASALPAASVAASPRLSPEPPCSASNTAATARRSSTE